VNIRYTGQIVLKVAFIAVCGFVAFGGNHPPSHAQVLAKQYVPVITTEDTVQDIKIVELNEHMKSTDQNVKDQGAIIMQMQNDMSGHRGEERVIGAVLGVIASSGLIIQWRRRPVV
jgi:hypothetical protein